MELGRVVLIVEIDGEVCQVDLSQDRLRMLIKLAEGLSDNGKVPIVELGPNYRIEGGNAHPSQHQHEQAESSGVPRRQQRGGAG